MSLIAKLLGASIPAWIVELVAVLALAGSGILYFEHRGASGELAKLQASSVALIAKVSKQIAAETVAHNADNAANQEKLSAALASNTALSSELDQRVRDFGAYRRAHSNVARSAPGAGATSGGECGAQSCSDLAMQLADVGNELARSTGELSATLRACERDRDSLIGSP